MGLAENTVFQDILKDTFLKKKNENKCEKCGWGEVNEFTGSIPLEVHHKDGDYRNNTEENLQLLCPNCHSLTETYKSHNKNGRVGRKKYCGVEKMVISPVS